MAKKFAWLLAGLMFVSMNAAIAEPLSLDRIQTLESPAPITAEVSVFYLPTDDALNFFSLDGLILSENFLSGGGFSTAPSLSIVTEAFEFLDADLLDFQIENDLIELLYEITFDDFAGFPSLGLATLSFDPGTFTAENALDADGALALAGTGGNPPIIAQFSLAPAQVPVPATALVLLPALAGVMAGVSLRRRR
ncbi:MAG: hypothetical protein ACFB22_05395 [Rhodothalassiaceae bacterium]